jgi:hypothetical protein
MPEEMGELAPTLIRQDQQAELPAVLGELVALEGWRRQTEVALAGVVPVVEHRAQMGQPEALPAAAAVRLVVITLLALVEGLR